MYTRCVGAIGVETSRQQTANRMSIRSVGELTEYVILCCSPIPFVYLSDEFRFFEAQAQVFPDCATSHLDIA